MNYEQKYKEALRRANAKIETYNHLGNASAVKSICEIFPELKESEDEKIRKAIIHYIEQKQFGLEVYFEDDEVVQKYISWLEKHCECNPYSGISFEYNGNIWGMCARDGGVDIICDSQLIKHIMHIENQGEKKPNFCHHEVDLSDCSEEYRKAYYDGWNNCNQQHAQLEGVKNLNYPYQPVWRKNRIGNKPEVNHSVLMLTNYGVAEGERIGKEWRQYRWSSKLKDEDVLYWLHLSDLEELEKENSDDEQKPTDKVEPKFKVGDWIVTSYGKVNQVITVDEDGDGFTLDDDTYFSGSWKDVYHLWTIQDAKDGDVLAFDDETIVIFKNLYNSTTFHSYCHIEEGAFSVSQDGMPDWWDGKGFHPATKEQRDILFQKMKESGYEWDAEKKELRKIEQKSAWSEEDEEMLNDILICGEHHCYLDSVNIAWLKSLKDRIQPQPKQEWSEEDDSIIKLIKACLIYCDSINQLGAGNFDKCMNLLEKIKPQPNWKPSEEQLSSLGRFIEGVYGCVDFTNIKSLYNDLKKL